MRKSALNGALKAAREEDDYDRDSLPEEESGEEDQEKIELISTSPITVHIHAGVKGRIEVPAGSVVILEGKKMASHPKVKARPLSLIEDSEKRRKQLDRELEEYYAGSLSPRKYLASPMVERATPQT